VATIFERFDFRVPEASTSLLLVIALAVALTLRGVILSR
jgi:hypothetical protein